jgi:hypothetical protein
MAVFGSVAEPHRAHVAKGGGIPGESGATPRPFEMIAFAFTLALLNASSWWRAAWARGAAGMA